MWTMVSPGLYRVVIGDQLYWAFSLTEVYILLNRTVDVVHKAA